MQYQDNSRIQNVFSSLKLVPYNIFFLCECQMVAIHTLTATTYISVELVKVVHSWRCVPG